MTGMLSQNYNLISEIIRKRFLLTILCLRHTELHTHILTGLCDKPVSRRIGYDLKQDLPFFVKPPIGLGNHLPVLIPRSPFGRHNVIIIVDFVKMGTFGRRSSQSGSYGFQRRREFARCGIHRGKQKITGVIRTQIIKRIADKFE